MEYSGEHRIIGRLSTVGKPLESATGNAKFPQKENHTHFSLMMLIEYFFLACQKRHVY